MTRGGRLGLPRVKFRVYFVRLSAWSVVLHKASPYVDEHNGNAEDMQGLGLYAAKSANARNKHQHAESGCKDADEIAVEKAFESLNNGGNSGEYVDQRDYGSDLLVFAFCHGFIPSFFKIRRGRAARR